MEPAAADALTSSDGSGWWRVGEVEAGPAQLVLR
jgi:hypothetical protein